MRFFVPLADSASAAESVYESVAAHVSASVQARRICSLEWHHQGHEMSCQVGGTLPSYYQTGIEPVIAIFDCGNLYKACTESRGVATGDGVMIGKHSVTRIVYFET